MLINGIQARAANVRIEQGVLAYKKAMLMYRAQYDTYPSTASTCLGDATTAPDGCAWTMPPATGSFVTRIKEMVTSMPKIDDNKCYIADWDGSCARNAVFVRVPDNKYGNEWVIDSVAHRYFIMYFLPNNGRCTLEGNLGGVYGWYNSAPNASGAVARKDNTSVCIMQMPD